MRKYLSYFNFKNVIQLIITSGLVLALDQASKLLVQRNMELYQAIDLIGGFFRIVYVRNTGAAFSILTDRVYLLIPVAVVAVVLILFFYFRLEKDERWMRLSLSFVLGGALGNLTDRIAYGSVVDFMDLFWRNFHWPTFNFADVFIDVGVAMIIIKILFFDRRGRTEEEAVKTSSSSSGSSSEKTSSSSSSR